MTDENLRLDTVVQEALDQLSTVEQGGNNRVIREENQDEAQEENKLESSELIVDETTHVKLPAIVATDSKEKVVS